MSLNDIVIEKVSGGLGRLAPTADGVCGLIAGGVAVVGGVQPQVVYKLGGIEDAVAIGITQQYDAANGILVYEHIKEYFRNNSNAELWFVLEADDSVYTDMFDVASTICAASKLLIESEGVVKVIGAALNVSPAPSDATILLAGIAAAQEWAENSATEHQPVQIILEGRGVTDAVHPSMHGLNAPLVSTMIGQNFAIANLGGDFKWYGAVGTALNAISRASVHENISYVRKFNMLGGNLQVPSVFKTSNPSNTLLETLNDQGYIFFRKHVGIAGIYFNDAHTCTAVTDDYCYIENNRTIQKAMRLIRTALLPDLGSPINVNPTTGQLAPEVVKKLEVQGKRAIDEQMLNQGEISGFTFRIDANQNILSTNELIAELEIVPTGTARKFIVKIGFTNPF